MREQQHPLAVARSQVAEDVPVRIDGDARAECAQTPRDVLRHVALLPRRSGNLHERPQRPDRLIGVDVRRDRLPLRHPLRPSSMRSTAARGRTAAGI